jgi:alkylated DNA nucleotide flippase Atl1
MLPEPRAVLYGPPASLQAFHHDLTHACTHPGPCAVMRKITSAAYTIPEHHLVTFHHLAHKHGLEHERLSLMEHEDSYAYQVYRALPHGPAITLEQVANLLGNSRNAAAAVMRALRYAGAAVHHRSGNRHHYHILSDNGFHPQPDGATGHPLCAEHQTVADDLYARFGTTPFPFAVIQPYFTLDKHNRPQKAYYFIHILTREKYLAHEGAPRRRTWHFLRPPDCQEEQ